MLWHVFKKFSIEISAEPTIPTESLFYPVPPWKCRDILRLYHERVLPDPFPIILLLLLLLWFYSPLLGLRRFFSFSILYKAGRTPWKGNQPVARSLAAHRTTQTHNKRTQMSMPWVGFEPTISAFERANTVHALDRRATVIGIYSIINLKFDAIIV
jgi:hypothetical protein